MLKAAEQDRTNVASQRAAWLLQQAGLDPDKPVFLDMTIVTTIMVSFYGRLVEKMPYGQWKSVIGTPPRSWLHCDPLTVCTDGHLQSHELSTLPGLSATAYHSLACRTSSNRED